MTKSKCRSNLTPERDLQVLRSQYVQAIMREQGLNISQAVETLNSELVPAGRGDTPSPSSGHRALQQKRWQSIKGEVK
jgi:hypothetical protein